MHRRPSRLLAAAVSSYFIAFSHSSAAQADGDKARAESPATGTRIVALGTAGGPLPRKDRAQSSNLLVVNGTPYLIDAGDGVTRRIVQSGFDFRQVRKIFITHPHGDHTAGLATLLLSEWTYQHHDVVDIYGPPGIEALIPGAIAYLKVDAEIRWTQGNTTPMVDTFRSHDVSPGLMYQDANVKVIAIENTHFNFPRGSPPYGKYKSYSYRFETPGRIIVFSGDTGPSDAVTKLAKDADVLVTEVGSPDDLVELFKRNGSWQRLTPQEQQGLVHHLKEEHLTPEDVGKMAAKASVKAVVMTHLLPTTDPNDEYQRYADEVKKYFSGQVFLAKDLMQF